MDVDSTQLIALAIAGILLPFVQERLVGAHIDGVAARWVNFAACIVIALVATWLTGGLGGTIDTTVPGGVVVFLLGKAAGVNALAQLVYGQFEKQVHVLGNTPG